MSTHIHGCHPPCYALSVFLHAVNTTFREGAKGEGRGEGKGEGKGGGGRGEGGGKRDEGAETPIDHMQKL